MPHHDKRGGFRATKRDKAPRRTHHAPSDSRRFRARSPTRPPTLARALPRRRDEARANQPSLGENPGTRKPFRRRRRSRPGRGRTWRGRGGRSRCSRLTGAVRPVRAALRVRWPRAWVRRPQAAPNGGGQGRCSTAPAFSDASAASKRPLERLQGGERAHWADFRRFPSAASSLRIMSDKVSLSDIPTPRQAGRIARSKQSTKRRQGFTMRQVIRADLDPRSPTRSPTSATAVRRAARAKRARASRTSAKAPGTASLSAAGGGPGLGAGERKGRGGRSPVRRRRRPRPARRRPARATRPPPGRCAPAWRFRAPRPPPKSCASTPTQARCATCASPSATPPGPRRNCCSCGATSPPGRPASTPAGSPPRRRGSTFPCRPERPRVKPEGLRRGGRSGFRGRARPPPSPSPPSRTPQRPKPKSSPFGCSTSPSPSGCAGRGPCR